VKVGCVPNGRCTIPEGCGTITCIVSLSNNYARRFKISLWMQIKVDPIPVINPGRYI
jgi:hypothetical protein